MRDSNNAETPEKRAGFFASLRRKIANGFRFLNGFSPRRFADKYVNLIELTMILVIPAIIAGIAYSWLERGRQKIEYIRMATGVLAQKVENEEDQRAIREWAVAVMEEYSPVALTGEQKKNLISGKARLPDYGYGDYGYSDWPARPHGGDFYTGPRNGGGARLDDAEPSGEGRQPDTDADNLPDSPKP